MGWAGPDLAAPVTWVDKGATLAPGTVLWYLAVLGAAIVVAGRVLRRKVQGAWFDPRCPAPAQSDLTGRTAAVTGASSGVGLEVAKDLARRGCNLLLLCRGQLRGELAAAEVKRCRRSRMQRVKLLQVDLLSLPSVRHCIQRLRTSDARVDYLIMCAAIEAPPRPVHTADGHDAAWQVNYLSHFALLRGLADSEGGEPLRAVVAVVSEEWTQGVLPKRQEEVSSSRRRRAAHDSTARFAATQRALALLVRESALRYPRIFAAAACTGHCAGPWLGVSRLGTSALGVLLRPFQRLVLRSWEQGAQTPLSCVLAAEGGALPSGGFWRNCALEGPAPLDSGRATAAGTQHEESAWLWEQSLLALGE